MIQVKKEPSKEEYQQIVKNLTPKHNSLLNCTKAFVTGGTFCVLGEVMKQLMMKYLNLSKKDSLLYVTIELILLSVLLTGFNFYGKITKFGGAGGLVPITGFANSVASAAIEYQKEGQGAPTTARHTTTPPRTTKAAGTNVREKPLTTARSAVKTSLSLPYTIR